MTRSDDGDRRPQPETQRPNREELAEGQQRGLRLMLEELSSSSRFYRHKIRWNEFDIDSFQLDQLSSLPLTTKAELVADQQAHPPYGSLLTQPLDNYVRIHRTSGTTGQPLRWLDTQAGWQAFLQCWAKVLEVAGVTRSDRVFVAFSFGPFIGFWGAFEAAQSLGALTVSGGSQTTEQRLNAIIEERATVLVCTPTYALHLAEVADRLGVDLQGSTIKTVLCAGEPGAGVMNVHAKLTESYGARVYDHAGATEVGAWGFPATYSGAPFAEMCINDEHFIAEVIDPHTGVIAKPDTDGVRRGELVITSFSRSGCALLRYRTGDSVQMLAPSSACPYHRLAGGVLGRVDDMFIVRGVNVFPSAIENVVLAVEGVAEFQATVVRTAGLSEIEIEIEALPGVDDTDGTEQLAARVAERLRRELSLRVGVVVASHALPRYELKARRFQFIERDARP